MFDGAIILADLYDDARPPRIIAPLQHLFDPVVGAADVYQRPAWWGASPVPLGRFSDCPRIVFVRLPALPALPDNLAEAMLYYLRLRLMDPALHIRHSLPAFAFARPALDEGVTILPA